jgi:methylamine---glutamate N-methyltransferase subunit A
MCGIAGLFIKDPNLQPQLGYLLTKMTLTLCSRGPDSAGFAIYGDDKSGKVKIVLAGPDKDFELEPIMRELARHLRVHAKVQIKHSHGVVALDAADVPPARIWLKENAPEVHVVSQGERLEIFKEIGYPTDVAEMFGIDKMTGTHGISHTRMATESAVTTDGSHPFSTGADQCLVDNGSLSNHASLRHELQRDGIEIHTQNDTEVAAAYLTNQMRDGKTLGEALESGLDDLDGFYTFVVGTEDGFGVLRDPIACKPAVMAETEQYVAFASEFKSLTCLPGIENAKVWEPKPATVYFWEHN